MEKLPELALSMVRLWSNVNVHRKSHSSGALSDQVGKTPALWVLGSLFPQLLEDLVKGPINKVAKVTGMEPVHWSIIQTSPHWRLCGAQSIRIGSQPQLTRYHASGTSPPPQGRLILADPCLHERVSDFLIRLNIYFELRFGLI